MDAESNNLPGLTTRQNSGNTDWFRWPGVKVPTQIKTSYFSEKKKSNTKFLILISLKGSRSHLQPSSKHLEIWHDFNTRAMGYN